MQNLKSLAKDTAIYGLSSIAARFIGYLLVPIETAKFNAAGGQYGIITNIYAYIALLIIILTYGMETTFFRFMNRPGEDLLALFIHPVASAIGYPDHPEYLMIMGVCVAIDAFTAIPFAYLRYAHRPIKFALLKMVSIAVNIVGVSLYLIVLPAMHVNLFGIYDANFDLEVVWVFWIELSGSVLTLLLLGKELKAMGNPFDKATCKRMLRYTWPLLVMGLAGQLNQCASQIIFPYVFDGNAHDARVQLGIYGACIKIATIMVMITQAFRYAYEPFVFGQSKEKNNKETYARVMKFYIIFTLLAFLCVVAYMDIIRYIIGRSYWEVVCGEHGAELFLRSEILSDRLSAEVYLHLHTACRSALCGHDGFQPLSADAAGLACQHAVADCGRSFHREERLAAELAARHREEVPEITDANFYIQ